MESNFYKTKCKFLFFLKLLMFFNGLYNFFKWIFKFYYIIQILFNNYTILSNDPKLIGTLKLINQSKKQLFTLTRKHFLLFSLLIIVQLVASRYQSIGLECVFVNVCLEAFWINHEDPLDSTLISIFSLEIHSSVASTGCIKSIHFSAFIVVFILLTCSVFEITQCVMCMWLWIDYFLYLMRHKGKLILALN